MVTVPRSPLPQVKSEVLPLVQADPAVALQDAGLAGSGGGGGGGGSSLDSATRGAASRLSADAERERERANLDAAQLAVLDVEKFSTSLLEAPVAELPGHEGPGLLHRDGDALFRAVAPAQDALADYASATWGRLSPEQQQMARIQLRRVVDRFDRTLGVHEAGARNRYHKGVYEAGQEGAMAAAVAEARGAVSLRAGVLQTQAIDEAVQDIDARVRVHATEFPELIGGMSVDEWIDAESLARTSTLHEQVLNALLADGKSEEAVDYLERYERQMLPDLAARARGTVNGAAEHGEHMHLLGQLEEAMPVEVGAHAALEPAAVLKARLDQVNEEAERRGWSPARREEARDLVRAATEQERKDAQALQDETFSRVDQAIMRARGNLARVRAEFPAEWSNATTEERLAWQARAEVLQAGQDAMRQAERIAELRTQSYSDPEGFKRRNLLHDMSTIGDDAYVEFQKLQKAMMDGETELASGALSVNEAVDGYLDQLYPGAKADGVVSERTQFRKRMREAIQVDQEIRREQANRNRRLSGVEVAELLEPLLAQRKLEDNWILPDVVERTADIPTEEVPRSAALAITRQLEAAGIPVTNDRIRAVYAAESAARGDR